MQVSVNGKLIPTQDDSTITDLISLLGFKNKRIAVELNQIIIPRSDHPTTILKQNDTIEIIHAIGGG